MNRILTGVLAASLVVLGLPVRAQWLHYPDPRTPRTKDGKPNLRAPTPRLNGKPDLSGVWYIVQTPADELKTRLPPAAVDQQVDLPSASSKYIFNLLWDRPEDDPSRPEALAIMKERAETGFRDLPPAKCLPGSVPYTYLILPFKIVQTPQQIVMLFEHYDPHRQIYTDGRPLPASPEPTWMGYAIGKWDGDTLIVESTGFNDKTWLDAGGHPHSEALRLTERYRRLDFGHMNIEVTVNDPKYYTRPFTATLPFNLIPDSDILEAVCAENEKDSAHLK
jgi:hypothetical protein